MNKLTIIIIAIVAVAGVGLGGWLVYRSITAPETGEQAAEERTGFGGLQPAGEAERTIVQPAGDEDRDGLTNEEETVWKTDPTKADTDGDGYLDGEEVAARHDPTKPAPDDKLAAGVGPAAPPRPLEPVPVDNYLSDEVELSVGDNITAEFQSQYDPELQSPTTMAQYAQARPVAQLLPKPDDNELPNPYPDQSTTLADYIDLADNRTVMANSSLYNQAQLELTSNNNPSLILLMAKQFRDFRQKLSTSPVPESAAGLHRMLLGYTEAWAGTLDQIAVWPEDPVKSMVASRQAYVIDRTYYPLIGSELQRLRQLQEQLASAGS